MITVKSFNTPEEAHLLKGQLEAAGIPASICNENTVGVDWGLSYAVGGIQIQISEEDVEAARAILHDLDAPSNKEPPTLTCPSCGSPHVEQLTLSKRLAFLSLLLFSLPIPFARFQFQCLDCKHKWKLRRNELNFQVQKFP